MIGIFRCSFFVLALLTISLHARQLFTPLDLTRGPLNKPYTDIFRNDTWRINMWTGAYGRSSCSAFDTNGCTVPLSTLFFNKADFNPQEAFAQSSAASILNPLLAHSTLGPRVRLEENGAVIGCDVQHYVNDCWRTGLRMSLPTKKIKIKRLMSHGNGMSDLGGATIDEFLGERIESVNGITAKSFAYRLDFLTKLPYTCKPCPTAQLPIVSYADTDFPPKNPISMSKQDITNQSATPVSALKNSSGRLPAQTWAIPQSIAQQLPALNADASNINDAQRGRFDASVPYIALGNDTENQSTLFIVPSIVGTNTSQEARVLQDQVEEVLSCIAPEAEDVFKNCGISFSSQTISGAGDLDTELYLGHFLSQSVYIEGFLGIRWPTGKRAQNPQSVFRPPLGNNGHYEIKAGAQALYTPCRWAALHVDITGYQVLRATESVAASFVGAQIKNIGTPICSSIRWGYYLLHTDLLFTPPNCHGFGAVVGYEYFHKGADQIRFCVSQITDCLGTMQPVDSRVITKNTRMVSHKARCELFIELVNWLQLFGGASTVFTGGNTPHETEWFVGFNAYF